VREVLLFCKKAAKNFLNLGLGRFTANATSPDSRKFLRRFFQKAALFAGMSLRRHWYQLRSGSSNTA
jgi:hypothetical protein